MELKIIIQIIGLMFSVVIASMGWFIAYKFTSSDFKAVEQVKSDTTIILATFRSLILKGINYSQQDKYKRDDPNFKNFINIENECKIIESFLNSPTAMAYHIFVAKKSKQAIDNNNEKESWRIFFLLLTELQFKKNPWVAAKIAKRLEKIFNEISNEDIKKMSKYLKNIPKAINNFLSDVDPLIQAFNSIDDSDPITEDNITNFFKFLYENKKIIDVELSLFIAIFNKDINLLKKSLENGAKKNITTGELVNRYKKYIPEYVKLTAAI